MKQPVWIIGCGDIGLRVGKLYMTDKQTVRGIVHSPESTSDCRQYGIECLQLDLDTDKLPSRVKFDQCDIFYFAPPPRAGQTDTRLQRFLNHITDAPRRIVLISTTGVYGDCGGNWVNETSPTNPQAERAIRRLDAEHSVNQWAQQNRGEYIILRVPGIYAADRLPLARLKQGLPVVNENEAPWTNRIHADDLAQVCVAAMRSLHKNKIYNVCDNEPSTMTDYFNQVADTLGLPRPPQITLAEARASLSPGMVSYLNESRRISNTKMLDELAVTLQYPSLKAGLQTVESVSPMGNHRKN